MNHEDYQLGIQSAFEVAALMMELELDELIEAVNHADELGLTRLRGRTVMEQHREILHALREAQSKIALARAELLRIVLAEQTGEMEKGAICSYVCPDSQP